MILQRVMTSAQISKRDRHEAMIRAGWRAALAAAPPSAPAPAGDLADAIAANAGVLHATIATLTGERDALRAVVVAADAMREAVICGFGVKVARDLYDNARAAVKGDR